MGELRRWYWAGGARRCASRSAADGPQARLAAAALAGVRVDGEPGAPGPVALAALPFDPAAAGSLRGARPPGALQHRRGACARLVAVGAGADPTALPRPAAGRRSSTHGGAPPARPARYRVAAVESPEAWMAAVAAAREAVRSRRAAQGRPGPGRRRVEADEPLDPTAVLRRLRASYPTCYRFAVDGFVGASPELLVGRRGDVVRAQPMAGTDRPPRRSGGRRPARRPGCWPRTKDRVEHQVTIDAVEAALLPYCSYLDAQADPQVVAVANVCTWPRSSRAGSPTRWPRWPTWSAPCIPHRPWAAIPRRRRWR